MPRYVSSFIKNRWYVEVFATGKSAKKIGWLGIKNNVVKNLEFAKKFISEYETTLCINELNGGSSLPEKKEKSPYHNKSIWEYAEKEYVRESLGAAWGVSNTHRKKQITPNDEDFQKRLLDNNLYDKDDK